MALLGAFALTVLVAVPGLGAAAVRAEGSQGSATTKSKTLQRVELEAGKRKVVDQRKVSVSVDALRGLRDRQAVRVSWSGAHPTGGLVADPNSGGAAYAEEYPMVLMQCRGVDSQNVPPSQRIRPETCWTQTPFERFNNSYGSVLPPWRLDFRAAKSERATYVGAPKKRPAQCFGQADAERWVPFEAKGGKVYLGGSNGCAGTAPEATDLNGTTNLPSNTTYAATANNGTGSAVFNVRTDATNASLGCNNRTACSLVAIPIMGISCDVDASGLPAKDTSDPDEVKAAADRCTAKGRYSVGENYQPNKVSDAAVTGSYWWSESNWRNRISFPLDFAPSAAVCDITTSGGESIFGSELMIQAMEQWSPVFCLDDRRTPVKQVQTGEPQARNLLSTGSIDAAMISHVPDATSFSRPVVKAPIASTGFAITFAVDDQNGKPLGQLRMTPRLLAKLMTLSYPAINAVRTDYDALSNNPLNVSADPEFQALNPSVSDSVGTQSAATLLNLSSDSDVMYALTSYIDADPEARAWLDGEPDPWGMRVNPNYKGIKLPIETWPVLENFKPKAIYQPGVNDCLNQNPVPYLPLVAAPLTRLSMISLAMQFSMAQSQVVCYLPSLIPGSTEGAKMVALGRQTPGFRFMLGVTSLADAERYEINEASLQTYVDKSADPELNTLSGRVFVAPTDTSLKAAVANLQPNTETDTWVYNYDKAVRSRSAAESYPGNMLVYAAIPTEGLEKTSAEAYAAWLRFAVTTGQEPGEALGELPPGYVPMTAANGMGFLKEYSLKAADDIEAQRGNSPELNRGDTPSDPPGGGNSPSPVIGGGGNTDVASDSPAGGPKADAPAVDQGTTPLGSTVNTPGGWAAYAVPIVLALAVVAGLVAGGVLLRDRLTARRSP